MKIRNKYIILSAISILTLIVLSCFLLRQPPEAVFIDQPESTKILSEIIAAKAQDNYDTVEKYANYYLR